MEMLRITAVLLTLVFLLSLPATSKDALVGSGGDCPELRGAREALRFIRESQEPRPKMTAECFSKQYADIPADDGEIESWLSYLAEGANFLRSMYQKSPPATSARLEYLEKEIKARTLYQRRIAQYLTASDSQLMRNNYAKSVDEVSNAIWLKAEFQDAGLQELNTTLADLDPMYIFDVTAARWIDAIRTCPQWVPNEVKTVPDFKGSWCPNNCADYYNAMSGKLSSWLVSQQSAHSATARRMKIMASNIKQQCEE